ncbi:MAG: hypothetical protein ACRCWY_03570 [Cellulosilyticaceae bacterium]
MTLLERDRVKYEEGKAEGKAVGEAEGQAAIIQMALANGSTKEQIAQLIGLTVEEVENILSIHKN